MKKFWKINCKSLSQISCFEADFPLLLLFTIPFGSYFILLLIYKLLPGGVTEIEEDILYLQGWVVVPLLTLIAIWGLNKIRQTWFSNQPSMLAWLLLIDSFVLVLLLSMVHAFWLISESPVLMERTTKVLVVIFPLINILVIIFLKLFPILIRPRIFDKPVIYSSLFPILVLLGLLNFTGTISLPFLDILVLATMMGFLSLLHYSHIRKNKDQLVLLVDVLIIILIILACFDPLFPINREHQNFYLGPVNDILRGKTVLVDTFSQYGILSLLFIAKLFETRIFPFNYQGFTLMVSVLYMAQFVLVYYISKVLLKSVRLAVLVLILILVVNFFATIGYAQYWPSIGPLRFGLSYLLLGFIIVRHYFPHLQKPISIMEYSTIGISSIWSVETFIYTITMYIGIVVFESILEIQKNSDRVSSFRNRLSKVSLSIVLFQILLFLAIWLHSGIYPKWDYYLELISQYVRGFGTLPIDPWSPWVLIVGIYFVSLLVFVISIIFQKHIDSSIQAKVSLGLTFLGVAQLTYYVGRSHPNNLLHVSIPAILIASYWVSQDKLVSTSIYRHFQRISIFAYYALASLLIITTFPTLQSKYNHTGFAYVQGLIQTIVQQDSSSGNILSRTYQTLNNPGSSTQRSAEVVQLIQKYWEKDDRVAIIINSDDETEGLILSRRTNLFPSGHPMQDSFSKGLSQLIVDYQHHLKEGDKIILLQKPEELLVQFQKDIVSQLCTRFTLRELESTSRGLSVVGLTAYQNEPGNICINYVGTDILPNYNSAFVEP